MPVLGKSARVLSRVSHPLHPYYVLEFDQYIGGHDGSGLGKDGYCWALPEHYLTKENPSVGFQRLTYRGIPIVFDPLVPPGEVRFQKMPNRRVWKTLSVEPNYASILRSNKNKEANMLDRLSAQLKRLVKGDEDLKALVEIGIYDEEMEVQNPALLLDMIAVVFKKELAEEARTRLAERKEEKE